MPLISLVTPCCSQIQHQPQRVVRVAGRLAERPLKVGDTLQGVLVSGPSGGTSGAGGAAAQLLLHPDDLPVYTKLHRGRVTQRQTLATDQAWSDIRLALEVMFEGVEGAGLMPVTSVSPMATDDGAAGASGSTAAGAAGSTDGEGSTDGAGVGPGSEAMAAEAQAVCVGDVVTVTYKQASPR